MLVAKADIINKLRKDILPLHGFKASPDNIIADARLGPIKYAFPNATFPTGAIHEFICTGSEDSAATIGFVSALLISLVRNCGTSLWISSGRLIFPPALAYFDIEPDKIVFIDLQKEKEILWAMEEALKCEGLSAVIGEMHELNFTSSRRLQLAVEKSRVTGFILRRSPGSLNTTACLTRWRITSLPSELPEGMPGVGSPRWNIELLKVRNGRPGSWQMEFANGCFRDITKIATIPLEHQKKAG